MQSEMQFAVINRIRVQRANALATPYIISPTVPFAVWGLAHAVGRDIGIQPAGVGIVHRDARLLGENEVPNSWRGLFYPHQYRGATYIDKRDYSSKASTPMLALQPTVSMHLELSVVFAFGDDAPSPDEIRKSLEARRLAGGQIVSFDDPEILTTLDGRDGVMGRLASGGFWIVDRSTELLNSASGRIETLFRKCNDRPAPGPDGKHPPKRWLNPAVVGYAAITPFEERIGARQGLHHAFAEPMVGLAEYISNRAVETSSPLFWRGSWVGSDVFAVSSTPISNLVMEETDDD